MMKKEKYKLGNHKVKVKRSSAGLGLFAVDEISKGSCIIEYVGRVLSKAEEYTSNSKYLFEVHSRMTIDGAARSNIARYVNHSCRPNVEAEIYKGHIYFMAYKKIKAGEELSFDYGKEYWDEHIKPKGCRCEKCRS